MHNVILPFPLSTVAYVKQSCATAANVSWKEEMRALLVVPTVIMAFSSLSGKRREPDEPRFKMGCDFIFFGSFFHACALLAHGRIE
jgi:hypothetical protein